MQGRRVAVTGIGVVAPCGIGKDAFWNGLCGPAPEGEHRVFDFVPDDWFPNPKEARRTDRFSQFALAAATMALDDSGEPGADPSRAGVIIATGVGGLATIEEQVRVYDGKGARRVSPFLVPMMMANAAAAGVSMRFGWQGPCENVVTACAASTHAIANAARLIAYGRCDAVLAGGSEAAMTQVGIQGFINMTALSSLGISRPFDAERDGFVIAEGAAVLVLEEWDAAHARGAHIYGEILGGASTADAHHITAPSPGGAGAIACIDLALAEAGVAPADIKQINAHGTSTRRSRRSSARLALPSPRRRASPGTRSGRRARSKQPRCCSRWSARSSRRPQGSRRQTPTCTSTSSTASRARGSRGRRCRTRSASAATTPSW